VCLALALALMLVLARTEASFSDLLARFQVATSLKELGRLHPSAPSWHTSMSIFRVVVKLNRPRGGGSAPLHLHLQLLQDSLANGRITQQSGAPLAGRANICLHPCYLI
jgi:hypothetical protein